MTSYHVRFWDTRKISDTARGRYRVRWVARRRLRALQVLRHRSPRRRVPGHPQSAARDGKPFDPATGLPAQPKPASRPDVTWYQHARAYSQMKWPDQAAKSRRSTAESLTTITLALTTPHRKAPDRDVLRRALFDYAFNPASTHHPAPADITWALAWIAKASLPMAALEEPDTVRAVLNACARRLDGKPAAATTTRRKRAVFANALGYAVDRRSVCQSRPGRAAPESRPGTRPARRAHGGVFRLPVLRCPATRRGGRLARSRLRPPQTRVEPDRPGRLPGPRRHRVDR
jgi:hypothetical protein